MTSKLNRTLSLLFLTVRTSPELFRFKTWPEAAKTKEPPKFPVGVPPPKTTTACPGFKIVFAGNS